MFLDIPYAYETLNSRKPKNHTFLDIAYSKMKKDSSALAAIVQQQPSRVLAEHDLNDSLLHSPNQVGLKFDGVLSLSGRNHKTPGSRIKSPVVRLKGHERLSVAVTCVQSVSSSVPVENTRGGDHTGNDGGFENCTIFGGTPFRKASNHLQHGNHLLDGNLLGSSTLLCQAPGLILKLQLRTLEPWR